MKIDPTPHLTIAQYSADLSADGMVDPMLSDALNAIGSKTFQVQFGSWDGSPAANAEQVLVLTGTVDTVYTSAKMLEVIATGGEQLTLDSNHSLFVGVLDYASTVDGRGSTGALTMELGGNNELAYGGQGTDVITCYGTNDQIILGGGSGAVGNLDGSYDEGVMNGAGQTLNASTTVTAYDNHQTNGTINGSVWGFDTYNLTGINTTVNSTGSYDLFNVTAGSAQIINASGNVDTFNINPGSDGVTVNASGMSNTFNLNGSTNTLVHSGDGTGATVNVTNAATGDVIVGGASAVIVHVTNGINETFVGGIGGMTVDMGSTVHAAQSMTFEGTPSANNFIVLNDAIDNGVGSIASNVLNTDGSRTVTFQDGAAIHFSNATLELPFNLGGGNIITAGGPPPDATIVGAATAHDLHLV